MRKIGFVILISALCFAVGCGGSSSSSTPTTPTTPTASCATAPVPLAQQVRNPASAFLVDNNGVIVEFPSVPVGGQATATGSLVFGIGTQPNNVLSGTTLAIDENPNDDAYLGFNTTLTIGGSQKQLTYGGFLDSGTNSLVFMDQATSGITDCPTNSIAGNTYYCPGSGTGLYLNTGYTATNEATNGTGSNNVSFSVSNAVQLFTDNNEAFTAFSDLAGPASTGGSAVAGDSFFDWGLPFFFGRNVFTSINNVYSGGPIWAYNATAGANTIAGAANNVATLTVDSGPVPTVTFQTDVAFVTVTICAPGSTTNCQTINHIMVDTGSTGLRVPYSVLNASLVSALQNVSGTTASTAECIQFLDNSFFWGSVRYADVKMGGPNNSSEVASSIPIQVMGDPALESLLPSTCSNFNSEITGKLVSGTEEDTVNALGANGLIGLGTFQYDCDVLGYSFSNACVSSSTVPSGTYYACSTN